MLRYLLHSPIHSPIAHVRLAAVAINLLLTVWITRADEVINSDGIMYINLAERILSNDWQGAWQLYSWPLYPALIAVASASTGFDLETAARFLDTGFSIIMSLAFISLVRELGGDRKTLWIAVFVIVFLPYLNETRAFVIRDHGYWALYLLGVLYFMRYYRQPLWRHALAWGICMTAATLFRVEGLAILMLLPLVLLTRPAPSLKDRFITLCGAYLVVGGFIVLGLIAFVLDPEQITRRLGRLQEAIRLLKLFWQALNDGLQARADRLGDVILTKSTSDYALPAIYLTLVLIVLDKTIGALTLPYTLLPWFRPFRARLPPPPGMLGILLWLLVINLAVALIYLSVVWMFSTRYVVATALTALVLVPFVLAAVHDQWRLGRGQSWRRRWIYPLILAGLIYTAADGLISVGGTSKAYIRSAGLWLGDLPDQPIRLYTNNRRIHYYAGLPMQDQWYAPEQRRVTPPRWYLTEQKLADVAQDDYDYLAVWIDRRAPIKAERISAMLGRAPVKIFENARKDAVLIYTVAGNPSQ